MKTNKLSLLTILLVGALIGCQEKPNEPLAPKRNPNSSARRACGNTISYAFIYPDNDYGYNTNGCLSYYVHRGSTRQVKVRLSNTVGYSQPVKILITYPYNPSLINYTVASVTGGTLAFLNPSPGTSNGAAIRWGSDNMPAFTTYELILNITGGSNQNAAENGVSLVSEAPCAAAQNTACDADENLHLVLTN